VHIANGGAGYAAFANGVPILTDTLPNIGLTYGAPAVSGASGLTGTVTCAIDGSSDLSCTAMAGALVGRSFDVVVRDTEHGWTQPTCVLPAGVDPGSAGEQRRKQYL
jgi:hypothetical protein